MAAHIKKLSLFLVAALVLVGSFSEYRITQAVVGEGTATIDGAGNVTVSQAVTHKFTVILTVGASGITADAENPTFTIPAGFTAPDHFPVASAGAVTADGNWFVAGGATCVIDSPSVGLTATSGQVITVDVTTACTVGAGGKITLTYQGQSAATMAATPLNIGTNDVISYVAVTPISAPPTITVIAGATPTPTPTPTPSATPTPTATPTATPASGGSQPATINVVKTVINDNGKTKIIADFPLFVNGTLVVSGVTNTFPAIGGIYTVTETGDSNYTRTFSGDCDANGQMNLTSGQNKFCIVTNNDIGAPIAVPPVPPLIDVVKVPSSLALPGGPGPVTYTYTLTNIGTVPVTNITMVGDTCSPIVLASGDTNGDVKLQVSETWTYRCTTSLSATHTNIVTTTGWANGISAVDIATATVVVGVPVIPPLIHVVKVPSLFTLPAPGGTVTYRYTVTNSGTAPLSDVTITDDKCTGLPGRVVGHPGDTNKNDLLESNES